MADPQPPPNPAPDVRIGSYRLIEPLGSGGMSSVFKAIHDGSDHVVAVKVLPRNLARSATMLQRFLREARNAETLEHPHIVAIYDRGSDSGRYYIVLEYVDGGDLHEAVRGGGPLGAAEVLEVARGVAEGLRYAAGRGVIHRDIKPANLLRTRDGVIKVADLGLALQTEADDERVTRDGTTVGTVDYMAPEQARDSRASSVRSDIYSLGCTLHFLLTGMPPFPGGDVADKLSRHCNEPPPDLRGLRPDVPEGLARMVARMMAKRPEDRFEDYGTLLREIAAIDPASADPDLARPTEYALIDDEPEDRPGGPDGWVPLGGSSPGTTIVPYRPRGSDLDLSPAGSPASLAELAALDEPEDRPARRVLAPAGAPGAEPVLRRGVFDSAPDEPAEGGRDAGLPASARAPARGDEMSTEAFVAIGLAIGLAVALVMVGVRALLAPEVEEAPIVLAPAPEPIEVAPPILAPPKPAPPPAPEPVKRPPPTWVEPAEDSPRVPPEAPFADGLEPEIVPAWALGPEPEPVGGPRMVVSRLPDEGADRRESSLKRAFDAALEGTLVLADAGPFFEDDLRVTGRARAVESAPGFRTLIRALGGDADTLRPAPAACVLEDKRLVLRGLDLVVDASELPSTEGALFLCRGATLELWDCTITVLNSTGRPFVAIQMGDAKASPGPSRVRLERTLIRGAGVPALAWEDEAGEVVASRSVLLSGQAPTVVVRDARVTAGRRLVLSRSLLAGGGPAVEVASARALESFSLGALGTTFARRAGSGPDSLLLIGDGSEPDMAGRWAGDANTFVGWGSLVGSARGDAALVADLDSAREAWPGSEPRSRSVAEPWPGPVVDFGPDGLESLAPEQAATLARVAAPTPMLRPKAVEAFGRLPVPPLDPRLAGRAPASPGGGRPDLAAGRMPSRSLESVGVVIASGTPTPAPGPGGGQGGAAPGAGEEQQELAFDAQAAPFFGDLGRFLQANVRPGAGRVRVVARGVGQKASTPIRLSDGVGLEVEALPPEAPGLEPLSWTFHADAPDEPALFQVVEADLTLINVRLARDERAGPGQLIRVVDGHLALLGCWLQAPGVVPPGAGGLVAFETAGTRPSGPRPGPFSSPPDRPTAYLADTLLMTGGTALAAEAGRAVLHLDNCAVVAAGAAFDLRPAAGIRRDRFEADLHLDRCTVAAEGDVVRLGPWPNAGPGPDRPWLVSSRSSAFFDTFDRPARRGVMLRSHPDGLPRGALIWQADGDAYEVAHFVAAEGSELRPNPRVDVRRQWVEFWGRNHIRNVAGPFAGRAAPALLPILERLTPGRVSPGELYLHPRFERDAGGRPIGADLRRLGIAPATAPPVAPRPGRRR